MVTLLGFACILANVVLLEIFVPDLIGPVLIHIGSRQQEEQLGMNS